MGLVALTVLKDFLGLSLTDTTYDSPLGLIGDLVSSQVESYCHRTFAAATGIEYFDIQPYQDAVFVSRFPIITVAALTMDGTLVAAADYKVYGADGIIKLSDRVTLVNRRGEPRRYFAEGKQTVEVFYRAGYTTIPGDLQLAVLSAASRRFGTRDKGGLASERIGGYQYTVADPKTLVSGFTSEEIGILRKYQRVLLYPEEN